MKKYFILLLVIGSFTFVNAQNSDHKLTDDFINFFVGNWYGEGEFSSGKKISANLTFKMTLNNNWLSYEHTDLPPNKYKALSYWGIDRSTGEFVAYSVNNLQGHKRFSSNGWVDGKLILSADRYFPGQGLVFEHFIYEKKSEKSFKMTYEMSKDGMDWKMIDYLVFNKQ
ncbi:hypothetical protein PY092_13365 [Muricauda sp. 334s03]|uniref:DUF1579 domain-containing protein n=1 Tax=Flagellimonas yonaguniensis TaxID=3031325 RepID=A0ABT5Y128_9FLAO|nr:hypothetical protein [[Muricauda] yonaguniensis]MDF0717146.1 hypothetical protein [[Muricauda] yonaguniensis]